MVMLTNCPCDQQWAPELGERRRGLKGQHAARKKAGEQDDSRGADADNVGLDEVVGPVAGLRVQVS